MKYKITDMVIDYNGKPLKEGDKELDWRTVVHVALNSTATTTDVLTNEQKAKCYGMTLNAFQNEEVEFTIEEVAFLMERIKKVYKPVVIGRAEEFFNKKNGKNLPQN